MESSRSMTVGTSKQEQRAMEHSLKEKFRDSMKLKCTSKELEEKVKLDAGTLAQQRFVHTAMDAIFQNVGAGILAVARAVEVVKKDDSSPRSGLSTIVHDGSVHDGPSIPSSATDFANAPNGAVLAPADTVRLMKRTIRASVTKSIKLNPLSNLYLKIQKLIFGQDAVIAAVVKRCKRAYERHISSSFLPPVMENIHGILKNMAPEDMHHVVSKTFLAVDNEGRDPSLPVLMRDFAECISSAYTDDPSVVQSAEQFSEIHYGVRRFFANAYHHIKQEMDSLMTTVVELKLGEGLIEDRLQSIRIAGENLLKYMDEHFATEQEEEAWITKANFSLGATFELLKDVSASCAKYEKQAVQLLDKEFGELGNKIEEGRKGKLQMLRDKISSVISKSEARKVYITDLDKVFTHVCDMQLLHHAKLSAEIVFTERLSLNSAFNRVVKQLEQPHSSAAKVRHPSVTVARPLSKIRKELDSLKADLEEDVVNEAAIDPEAISMSRSDVEDILVDYVGQDSHTTDFLANALSNTSRVTGTETTKSTTIAKTVLLQAEMLGSKMKRVKELEHSKNFFSRVAGAFIRWWSLPKDPINYLLAEVSKQAKTDAYTGTVSEYLNCIFLHKGKYISDTLETMMMGQKNSADALLDPIGGVLIKALQDCILRTHAEATVESQEMLRIITRFSPTVEPKNKYCRLAAFRLLLPEGKECMTSKLYAVWSSLLTLHAEQIKLSEIRELSELVANLQQYTSDGISDDQLKRFEDDLDEILKSDSKDTEIAIFIPGLLSILLPDKDLKKRVTKISKSKEEFSQDMASIPDILDTHNTALRQSLSRTLSGEMKGIIGSEIKIREMVKNVDEVRHDVDKMRRPIIKISAEHTLRSLGPVHAAKFAVHPYTQSENAEAAGLGPRWLDLSKNNPLFNRIKEAHGLVQHQGDQEERIAADAASAAFSLRSPNVSQVGMDGDAFEMQTGTGAQR